MDGKPHYWPTVISDRSDFVVSHARLQLPDVPDRYTLVVADPNESGPKGGIRIMELLNPGRSVKPMSGSTN